MRYKLAFFCVNKKQGFPHIFDWSKVMFAPAGTLFFPLAPGKNSRDFSLWAFLPVSACFADSSPAWIPRKQSTGFFPPWQRSFFLSSHSLHPGTWEGRRWGKWICQRLGSIFPSSRNFFMCRGVYFMVRTYCTKDILSVSQKPDTGGQKWLFLWSGLYYLIHEVNDACFILVLA